MAEIALIIKRIFNASPEEVFEAWTDPKKVAQWYGPEGFKKTDIHSFDVREGGSYSLTMNAPDGGKHKLSGVFKTIEKPNKLVLTWQWEEGGKNNMRGKETLVTVELKALGDKTEMTFTHSGFANVDAKRSHNMGWIGSFNKLEKMLK
jgi:uncharacterized protein YndB with AHSA1/START domain